MNVVDSSGWLEYFAGSDRANLFAPVIENPGKLIVPSICVYEVFKKVLIERDEDSALVAIAHMHQATLVDLDSRIAIFAATLSKELKLPMADSIILATARLNGATLWTQDEDFHSIDGVKYFPKK